MSYLALCPPLSDPDFGMVDMPGRSVDDRATYSCIEDYDLFGRKYVECWNVANTGVWSDDPPICLRKYRGYHVIYMLGLT